MNEPRGAGRGGGLLFVAVLLFVAYLVAVSLTGTLRVVLSGALVVLITGLALSVVRRR